MRIVILGDFHIDAKQLELTESAMEDIARVDPDLVIPLGDFGRNGRIGRPDGLMEAHSYLEKTGAPLRPIMGNHDLERESGGQQTHGTMQQAFLDIFALPEPYGVLEFPEWRLFFASTEPQPADDCYDVQECYATDRQFDDLVAKLEERPGVPVLFFTHAPPIGSGLRTVPRVHVRSTNAYLDQNHDPYRWLELVNRFPEIILWFSAHYHLSQGYPNSHQVVQGTHFFLTGVHSSCTRDGKRQSRVLEIDETGLQVRTLDHIHRQITDEGAFTWERPPHELMGQAGQENTADSMVAAPVLGQESVATSLIADTYVGETPSLPFGLVPAQPGRYIVATEDGFSWETEPTSRAVLGTLHIGPPLSGLAVTDTQVWMSWDNRIGYSSVSDPWRFVRFEDGAWPQVAYTFEHRVEAICRVNAVNATQDGDLLLVAADGWLWEANTMDTQTLEGSNLPTSASFNEAKPSIEIDKLAKIQLHAVTRLPHEPCQQLITMGEQVWALASSGTLYLRHESKGEFVPVKQGVVAFDAWQDGTVTLLLADGQYFIQLDAQKQEPGLPEHRMMLAASQIDSHSGPVRLVYLGQGAFALVIQGIAFFGSQGLTSLLPLPIDPDIRVTSISRSPKSASHIAIAGIRGDEDAGLLQVWQLPDLR